MKTKNFTQRLLFTFLLFGQTFILFSQASFDLVAPGPGFFPNFGPFQQEIIYLYVPDNNNTLTIREKSDFKFSFDRKIKSKNNPIDEISRHDVPLDVDVNNFRLGYSPLPHLYGTASLLLVTNREETALFNSKMTQGDIGIGGYYLKEFKNIFKKENLFNKTAPAMMQKKGLLVNALLGYSRGIISHELTRTPGLGKFRLNKFYGQIGFDYQARIWGIAGTAKVGVLNYGLTSLEGRAPTELFDPITVLKRDNNYKFSEISIRFYVGMKFGQIYIKGMKSKTHKNLTYFVIPSYWSVGAVLDL